MNTRIKEIRMKKGLTQKELSEQSNLSERQIIRIENNKSNPTLCTLDRIAKALNKTVDEIF